MRVLVTGGAGYLGCRLVPVLLEQGHRVRVFDRFAFGEEPIEPFADSPDCDVVRGDMRRLQECSDLLKDIEAIVHLAGIANDPSCDLDPDMAMDVNFECTKELADLAIHQGIRRFVFASSCSVYGKGVFDILDEESPLNPVSTYARTKRDAEQALLRMRSAHFEPVIARPGTFFGWSRRMRFDLAVNQMAATATRNQKIQVYGGGRQWRPFVHVRDAAHAFVLMLEASGDAVSGQVFNVGSEAANFRILDLAEHIAEQLDGVTVESVKSDEDVRSHRVLFGKIEETLGFSCEKTIADGVEEIRRGLEDASVNPFASLHFNVLRMKELLATPVDEGGEPIAPRFIPLARPTIGPEEEQAMVDTLRSGWLTTGARVQAFERAVADAAGSQEAVAVTSCTAALQLCMSRLGVGRGDEVILTPLTWPSAANAVVHLGAKVVLADICRDTLNIDPAAVERVLTNRTKVIMPVHLGGLPCDLDALNEIARKHDVNVVEDAAHALGARYKGKPVGSYGDYACFSFYPIKNVTTIDGGVITLEDKDEAENLRILANNGMSAIAWNRYGRSAVASPPQVIEPGFKSRMHDVSAAIGLEQMKKLDGFLATRRRLARMYRTVLAEIDEISLPEVPDDVDHAWHLLIIRLKLDRLTKTRDEIAYDLRRENVGTGVHFLGLHLHQYYREVLGVTPADLPEATAASREILSLPLFPKMTDKDLREVVDALKKVLAHARK